MVGLYIHIPFCTKKCDYCHFFVLPNKKAFHEIYLEALAKEWALVSPKLQCIRTLYFGGGTPSLLGPEAIGQIISWINPGEIEITLEANPELLDADLLCAYRAAGINRLSIGVQSFDDTLLKRLSRTHSAKDAAAIVSKAQQAGFDNISIDLMYDVPGQTLAQWKETLALATALPVTHISLYNLTIEPHTSYYKRRAALEQLVPSEEESFAMLDSALAHFSSNGFERYEISAFCREEKVSEHNLGYWTQRPFYGLGPSAFSYIEGKRFQNVAHLHRYAKALDEGQLPIDYEELLDPQAQQREALVLRLRTKKGCHLKKFPLTPEIEELVSDELLEIAEGHVRLTEKGKRFYDTVAAHLI